MNNKHSLDELSKYCTDCWLLLVQDDVRKCHVSRNTTFQIDISTIAHCKLTGKKRPIAHLKHPWGTYD